MARRPRFTGRFAILVLVVALLTVSYASSMRAYAQQRAHIQSLRHDIATSKAQIDQLTREKRRWHDPAYIRAQAHRRFGWVLPGEITFQVIGADGKPLGVADTLPKAEVHTKHQPAQWWQSAWRSDVLAGSTDK
ncbi:MAG TPA: septum formation initiator family protein [Nocardioidaceae bacterium]|nr:septum formation initiator family protein [Nocardioidaceae bacterium]